MQPLPLKAIDLQGKTQVEQVVLVAEVDQAKLGYAPQAVLQRVQVHMQLPRGFSLVASHAHICRALPEQGALMHQEFLHRKITRSHHKWLRRGVSSAEFNNSRGFHAPTFNLYGNKARPLLRNIINLVVAIAPPIHLEAFNLRPEAHCFAQALYLYNFLAQT